MKKRDLLTPIGITFGFAMIILGIAANSGFSAVKTFLDVASLLIVLGGVTASLLISYKKEEIRMFTRVFRESFYKNDQRLPELIQLFVKLSERARREGILALENELEEVEDPFIKKGILLAVDGLEPEMINDILTAEVVALEERHEKGRSILEKAADYSPAWGMVGTLIGLILMLGSLDDPSSLGPSMAVALITTMYGVVLANLVFSPMANKLANKTDEEVFIKQIIIEGVIGVQSGQNPRILEEKLSAFLSEDDKIRVRELEESEMAEGTTLEGNVNEA